MSLRASRLHSLALWLAMAGVLLRAAVPFGYMPGWMQAGGHGSSSLLVLCSASDHSTLASTATPQPGRQGDDGFAKLQTGCAFASAAAAAPPPVLPAAGTWFTASTAARADARASSPRGATATLPPPRGPPEVLRIG